MTLEQKPVRAGSNSRSNGTNVGSRRDADESDAWELSSQDAKPSRVFQLESIPLEEPQHPERGRRRAR